MPAALVTLAEFDTFLGGAVTAENTIRQALLDEVEALLLSECGRTAAPFAAAQSARVEKCKGTGSETLHLAYTISTLTSIVLGHDTAAPDETITVADKTVLIYEAGKRKLTRVDGGRFGQFNSPAYVHVTYNAEADLPKDASLAVLRMAAIMYRQRGAEDAASETIGGQAYSAAKAEADAAWMAAVANHTRASL